MVSKKKKVTETLSKIEKEFLTNVREILKRDLGENYKSFREDYEESFLGFEEGINRVITKAKTDFENEEKTM